MVQNIWAKNKNFEISIGFFSLQGKPALLVPWMVYTIVFLIVNTALYIYVGSENFSKSLTHNGSGSILGVVVTACK